MLLKRPIKIISIIILSFLLISINSSNIYAVNDIEGHWAANVILEWINNGLAKGYPDDTFKPNNNITRAEFMNLINNAFIFTEEEPINFLDVDENKWYYSTIKKAKAAGYINGYPDGTMKPGNPITREEVAAIIARILNLEEYKEGTESFTDKDDFTWSKGYIGAVTKEGFMIGYPDGSFKPTKNITRGEAIYALNNVIKKTAPKIIAKQDFLGITYIQLSWNKEGIPSSITANGQELLFDATDGKWKGTSLNLNLGDNVEIIVIINDVKYINSSFIDDLSIFQLCYCQLK